MRVIGYYSRNTPYQAEAAQMASSAEDVDLEVSLVAIDDLGSWQANTQAKARVLRDALKNSSEPLLYVDADARFNADPRPLLPSEHPRPRSTPDLSVFVRRDGDRGELLSGTLWLNTTVRCMEVLDAWVDACAEDPDTWDQKVLQRVLFNTPGLTLELLDPALCFIFDTMRMQYPGVEPVIEHFQASRKYRSR